MKIVKMFHSLAKHSSKATINKLINNKEKSLRVFATIVDYRAIERLRMQKRKNSIRLKRVKRVDSF